MLTKVGRFDAYVPGIDLFSTILTILSKSLPKKGMKFLSPLVQIHEFFFNMKQEYPEIFEDVNFRLSPDFKYSKEIADCLIELQEAGYLTRPNPSLSMYRIDTDLAEQGTSATEHEHQAFTEISKKFNSFFQIIDDERYATC